MKVDIDDLGSIAIHALRRLAAGEEVEATDFQRTKALQQARDQLRRGGLVAEQTRGRKAFFVITAIGRQALPAIARRDAATAAENIDRATAAARARRVRDAAPLLLSALRGLLSTCEDADTGSADDAKFEAAMARQHQAMVVARDAIKHATSEKT